LLLRSAEIQPLLSDLLLRRRSRGQQVLAWNYAKQPLRACERAVACGTKTRIVKNYCIFLPFLRLWFFFREHGCIWCCARRAVPIGYTTRRGGGGLQRSCGGGRSQG